MGEGGKGSSGRKYTECKFSNDNVLGVRKHIIVIDETGINKKFIFSSCCRDQTEENYENTFAI